LTVALAVRRFVVDFFGVAAVFVAFFLVPFRFDGPAAARAASKSSAS
jgi:hypothetical protein